jgi:hypothetical protein
VQDAVVQGQASADYDLIILHRGMADQDFPHIYAQLQQNYDLGGLPMVVVVQKAREKVVRKLVATNPNTLVITEDKFKPDDVLKAGVEALIKNAQIAKLTPAERKEFSQFSMYKLWQMGRGELQGYDITPALDVIIAQLKSPDDAVAALEIMGRQPGKNIQNRLAALVGDGKNDIKLRMPAVIELNRHLQRNGVLIDKRLQNELKLAQKEAADGSPIRAQLNVTVSMMTRVTAPKTGADLIKFRPDAPAPPK